MVELFRGIGSLGTTTTDNSGNWSLTVASTYALWYGSDSITAKATDAAGNISNASSALDIDIFPSLDSAVYDNSTGVLKVTANALVGKHGSTNDIDVSKLTITGEAGSSYTLTSADVEVSSSTQFSVTLNAVDQLNVGGLLNKNGTSSDGGSTYNIAAADDWVAGAAASVDISDTSGNGITVSNVNTVVGWKQIGDDIDGEAAGDIFGQSVSMSADGRTLAVGASSNDGAGSDAGHVRIFKLSNSRNWLQIGADIDGEASTDNFGSSVSLSSDGSIVAIGAPSASGTNSDSGHVRLYQLDSSGNWVQLGSDIDGEFTEDYFGWSVSLSADGKTVAIGADSSDGNGSESGHVRVYRLNGSGNWLQLGSDLEGTAAGIYFGSSVSISSDGSIVAIGAPYNKANNGNDAGHVKVYQLSSDGDWSQLGGDLEGEAADDFFGYRVSLDSVGNTLAVGAYGNDSNGSRAGHVRVYKLDDDNKWVQIGSDIDGEAAGDDSGASVSLSADGTILAVGAEFNDGNANDAGHVRVYQLDVNGDWAQYGDDIDGVDAEDNFGWSASLSDSGKKTSIGADVDGSASKPGHVRVYEIVDTQISLESAAYDAANGTLTFTGSNFVNKEGSSNDIDVSQFSITGEGGSSYSLTSSDVEVNSRTEFSVSLNEADKLRLSQLLNKDGRRSLDDTNYRFTAADDWMTGAADSIDISDVIGNAITVSNIPPLFTSPASASVNENIGSNQVVYTATASDSSAVTFSLKADTGDVDHFNITSSGNVSLIDNPEYDDQRQYLFTVVATDSQGNSSEQAVTLDIKIVLPPAQNVSGEVSGTQNTDYFIGSSSADSIHGYAGSDLIYGREGNDTLEGGLGHDTLYGEDWKRSQYP